jgi:hypothetical protein
MIAFPALPHQPLANPLHPDRLAMNASSKTTGKHSLMITSSDFDLDLIIDIFSSLSSDVVSLTEY